jgi:hypothetical protein
VDAMIRFLTLDELGRCRDARPALSKKEDATEAAVVSSMNNNLSQRDCSST